MRDLIKILIALAFIAIAFWVGNYVANEKCSTHVNELNTKSETDKKLIQRLHDSICILKADLENEKAKSKIDAVKIKPSVIQK